MTKNESTLDDLYSAVTRPRYYGEKYLKADTEENLLLILAEACCISAFSLVLLLKLPIRGRLVLALIKAFSPQLYRSHQSMYHVSFSHCLVYIIRKLKKTLKRELSEEDAERISSTAYAYAASYLSVTNKYSVEDKQYLLKEIKQRLHDYGHSESIEEQSLLENILNGMNRKISPKHSALFLKEIIEKDALYLVEPFHFLDRLIKLRS